MPGLRGQAIRSAGSVSDNIAEGYGRGGDKEFRQYLTTSLGSLSEMESQLSRALDAKILAPAAYLDLLRRIIVLRRMITSYRSRLSDPDTPPPTQPTKPTQSPNAVPNALPQPQSPERGPPAELP